jgi:hypothetical protein
MLLSAVERVTNILPIAVACDCKATVHTVVQRWRQRALGTLVHPNVPFDSPKQNGLLATTDGCSRLWHWYSVQPDVNVYAMFHAVVLQLGCCMPSDTSGTCQEDMATIGMSL